MSLDTIYDDTGECMHGMARPEMATSGGDGGDGGGGCGDGERGERKPILPR